MTRIRSTRILVCLGLTIASTSCAVDLGDLTGSDDTAPEAGTTAPSTTATSVASSAEAAALRAAGDRQPDLPPDVVAFFQGAPDARLDELGLVVCGQTSADMSTPDFGSAAIVTRDQLTAEEQAQLDLAEFGAAFRVVAETYCPAQVPADLDQAEEAAEEATSDTTLVDPPASGGNIAGYRAILPTVLVADHAALGFVEAATDERLDELQASACAVTTPDLTATDFGFVVINNYATSLTDEEKSRLTIELYAELFGSFVGWFCEERLPAGL